MKTCYGRVVRDFWQGFMLVLWVVYAVVGYVVVILMLLRYPTVREAFRRHNPEGLTDMLQVIDEEFPGFYLR